MLLFDPILCTDPAKIVNFQTEYFVVVQQSVTLNCGAEGNPPPTYTWIPCDPEQVCNKKTLDISQVLNDASYTCRVANVHGPDTKTAIVCKFYVSSTYTAVASYLIVPTWHFDWVLRVWTRYLSKGIPVSINILRKSIGIMQDFLAFCELLACLVPMI